MKLPSEVLVQWYLLNHYLVVLNTIMISPKTHFKCFRKWFKKKKKISLLFFLLQKESCLLRFAFFFFKSITLKILDFLRVLYFWLLSEGEYQSKIFMVSTQTTVKINTIQKYLWSRYTSLVDNVLRLQNWKWLQIQDIVIQDVQHYHLN